jgi:hypothetical protein
MPGVGAAAVAYHYITVLGEDIYNLAFTLVAPLQTDYATIHFYLLPIVTFFFMPVLSRIPILLQLAKRRPKINRKGSSTQPVAVTPVISKAEGL